MDKIDEILTRRVEKIYPSKKALEKLLRSGKKIKLYLGIDPSDPKLHLGHTLVLRKIREFQDLGHEVILLIGDFTGRIGDPAGKLNIRKKLTQKQVIKNAKTYKEQANKILRFSGKNPVQIKFNSQWLDKLTFTELIDLAYHFTVQQFIERDMYQERMKRGKPIALSEFLYPLMQAYDGVVLKIDMEVGGNDQTFNMLIGRDLVKAKLDKEKFVLTVPLLMGADGQKMGKSLGNYISLTEEANNMYGKVMSVPDDLIIEYLELCTDVPLKTIKEYEKELKRDPMTLKKKLAFEITKTYHGEKKAKKAEKEFRKVSQEKKMPSNIPYAPGKTPPGKYTVKNFLVSAMVGDYTASEIKRLILGGTVVIDGKKYTDPQEEINIEGGEIIKYGKISKGKICKAKI